MERTTIYLNDILKKHLLDISEEETRKRGKRIGMAEMIREAIIVYLKKKGKPVDKREILIDRMLSTRGTLSDEFERRIKKVRKELNKWKIESV
jgi:hypothetical protein